MLVEQGRAGVEFGRLIEEIGQSSAPEDRSSPPGRRSTSDQFPHIRAVERAAASAVLEVMAEYREVYTALYDSVKRGDIGDPALADQLVDPYQVQDPAGLANPTPIIVRAKAADRAAAAASAQDANEAAEQLFSLLAPGLYALGVVLVVVLLAVTLNFGRREARAAAENAHLRRLSTTDPMTRLGNRRGFEEATKKLAKSSDSAASASLVMMDLDEFKVINDTFGHARGDLVLVNFADILNRLAPAGASRFRIGGDEFALILHGLSGEESFAVAEKVRREASSSLGNGATVSAGIAVMDPESRDAALLLQRADAALYEGKMRGRNLTGLYKGDAHAPRSSPRQSSRRTALLEEGRINAVFQPIGISLSQCGYEAFRGHTRTTIGRPPAGLRYRRAIRARGRPRKLCRNTCWPSRASSGTIEVVPEPVALLAHAQTSRQRGCLVSWRRRGGEGAHRLRDKRSPSVPRVRLPKLCCVRSSGLSVALERWARATTGWRCCAKVSSTSEGGPRRILAAAE